MSIISASGAVKIGILSILLQLVVGGPAIAALENAGASQRLALLIGNSRYEQATPLRNPENDIELVRLSLEAAGFQIMKGQNLNAVQTKQLIEKFVQTASRMKRPTLLFYFAGHGVQFSDKNYLLPVDAPVNNRKEVIKLSINAQALLNRIKTLQPSFAFLVLDSCRDDPFEKATRGLKRGLSPMVISDELGKISRLIAYSTAPGTVADDGDAGTSPYASAFAESILVPGLTIDEVFLRTRVAVFDRTKGAQEPWEDMALFDEFIFIPKSKTKSLTKPESEIWDFASIVNSAEGYQRYLDKFPGGTFANIAKTKIDAINRDFSYRRKAERFPILVTRRSDYDRCRGGKKFAKYTGAADIMNLNMAKYANQVVYVNMEVPINAIFCDGNHHAMSFFKGTSKDCDFLLMGGFISWFDSSKIECITRQVRFEETRIGAHLKKHGGLLYRIPDGTWIMPHVKQPFYELSINYTEGIWDEMYLSVRGLVRVHVELLEFYYSISFEPIDPKVIGLTWKYQNTLNEALSDKHVIFIAKKQ